MSKRTPDQLGAALKGFLCDYLPKLKGASRHTIHSYRDSLKLLLVYLAGGNGRVDSLSFRDINVARIVSFLDYLETERTNCTGTRNVRLAAVHSFFRYVASGFPEHVDLAQQILSLPFKRTSTRPIQYLESEEITAVLQHIDRSHPDGRRDYLLVILMFNTGARVQEIVDIRGSDLHLSSHFTVCITGKGRKQRICPIWTKTANFLREHVEERGIDLTKPASVFTNHLGSPLTRFGVRYILDKCVHKAAEQCPALRAKRLHPHSMRHSTAVHLLKSGVDLASIANWLGHASLNTTNKYATLDLDMKREALAKTTPPNPEAKHDASWRQDPDMLAWLASL